MSGWQRSFTAVSVLLGGGVDDAVAALGGESGGARAAGDVVRALRDPRRAMRAQTLAVVAGEVAAAVDEVTLL